ncbi:drug/metabolite transporter (DMT)-like permease [Elusimicrobium simillimum]|uniref:DMT family transporter n=1 Tax=Elusimicrobium simillimum TaxID=3143438 RepID=UPI003C6ED316
MQNKNLTPAILGLFAITFIWSYNWVVMKSVLLYIGALEFAALRCLSGAAILFLLLAVMRKPLAPPPLKLTLVVGLLQTAGMTGLTQMALISGGAGKTAVIAYAMPFWVIILAAIVLKEKTTNMQKLAFTIAAVGLLFVISPWDGTGGPLISSVFALVAGMMWAGGSVAFKKIPHGKNMDLMNFTAWQILIGAVILAVAAIATHTQPIVWNMHVAGALAYNAVLATAFAWMMWLYVLKTLPAGIAGLSTLLVPVLSVLFTWWKLGERPDIYQTIGVTLIVAALLMISLPGIIKKRRGRKPKNKENAPIGM